MSILSRQAHSAGAPLPVEVARDFAARCGGRLHSFYGSSETGGIAFDATGVASLQGGVGRALSGVTLTALPRHQLLVRSAAVVTRGHRQRRGRYGAWKVTDLVALDAKAQLTVLGRRGTTVKISGRRVNLAEVTARLRGLRGVRAAWVGISASAEPVLGAVVASERQTNELRAALFRNLAAWKIPKKLIALTELPLSARGKIDTRALQARLFPLEYATHAKE